MAVPLCRGVALTLACALETPLPSPETVPRLYVSSILPHQATGPATVEVGNDDSLSSDPVLYRAVFSVLGVI